MVVLVRHINIGRIKDGTKAIQSYFPLEEDKDKAEKARKTANNWAMRWLIGFWLLVAWIFRKPIWKFVYKIISPIKF